MKRATAFPPPNEFVLPSAPAAPGSMETAEPQEIEVTEPQEVVRAVEKVRVFPTHGMQLYLHTQGIIVPPGEPTEVLYDHLVYTQIQAGYLTEV